MSWDIDSQGNIVWVEGEPSGGNRVYGIINERTPLGQAILENRAAGRPGLLAPPPSSTPAGQQYESALAGAVNQRPFEDYRQYIPYTDYRSGGGFTDGAPSRLTGREWTIPTASDTNLDFLLGAPDGSMPTPAPTGAPAVPTGYSPRFVDTSAAEAMLPLEATPQEIAALEELLADLDARAGAATTAVRTGWDAVRSMNQAAAAKARQMAVDAGPVVARLWIDAANNALNLARQTAQAMGQFAGMQGVNISPTAGVMNISALMAAQAPRAQALAERLGIISSEDIASQARTAAMMGESYAGEIQRTSLIQAQQARQQHNERVMSRIAANQSQIASMRFQAAQTNAQIANDAARFAASQVAVNSPTPQTARERLIELDSDIRRFSEYTNGEQMLMQLYPELDVATASALLNGFRTGSLGSLTARGLVESGVPAPEALVQGGFTGR